MTKSTDAIGASKTFLRFGVSMTAVALAAGVFAVPAMAQDAAPAAPTDGDVVVVTGFRGSLQTSISAKKRESSIVDVITAEDIADFPDNNLAESLQRIPGIAIDRDGGEGRTITVRGLGSQFTRVRINGLEALATAGGKDSTGANLDRGFDFNVFASELFKSLTVRKSQSANVDEGSLGATVDLQTSRPFDYKGFTLAGGAQVAYNDRSEDKSPRYTFLVSNRWADGKLGALLSVAYSERTLFEEGPSSVRWENAFNQSNGGRFQNYSTDGGTTFTAIPASGTLTGEALKVSNALHPRIPRYGRLSYDQKRLGITGAFQMRPNPNTLISIEGLYSQFRADRTEHYLEVISFSRGGAGVGNPATDIYNYTISDQGVITKAAFNDVDVRSEHRFDDQSSTFSQLSLTWDQNFTERFRGSFRIGSSESIQDNPRQTTLSIEAYDVDGYSYDFTDQATPVFNYGTKNGCTVSQACYWTFGNGGPTGGARGDASIIRIRPNKTTNSFNTLSADFTYDLNDIFTLRFGASVKDFELVTMQARRASEAIDAADLTTLNGNLAGYTQSVTGFGETWLVPDINAIRDKLNYECNCGFYVTGTSSVGGSRGLNREAAETDTGAYVQLDFNTQIGSLPVRGDVGVRHVKTEQTTSGYLSAATYATSVRKYDDTLPSLNVTVEPINDVLIRFAAAKVMARPLLTNLTPGGTLSTFGLTYTGGNPMLDPIRSTNYDLNIEWYADKDTLFSVGIFQKDIDSYIQNRQYTTAYKNLGLDMDLIADATGQTGDTLYTVTNPVSTPGGTLKGYEISLQKPFTFLPGFLGNTGGIVNYTSVESQIAYYTSATTTATRTENLLGLSPTSWNATLYYEDSKLSGRVSAAYRDGYLVSLLPGSGADFYGKNETLNIDASASYALTDHLTVSFEAINLTDEADDRYVSYAQAATGNTGNAMLEYTQSGRQFIFGVRYKY
ncbi:tonB-dependent receptor family protein [Asticcacaulis biprosthecium C19]|uniref:TonB-dependent receptor family protein n=1 Tax=Asticcacaulis biprosthecium C19 TaxID=715226 RepID=F4QLV0_9CAUL|nr:TonB-dependent receptor [Asticcacaulis biprosthecium]EGF92369.1 tonB-dependent receptor family protein [Asticcacaulis biprosthecium C19]